MGEITQGVKTHRMMTPTISLSTYYIHCIIAGVGGVAFRATNDPRQVVKTASETVADDVSKRDSGSERFHIAVLLYEVLGQM
jgi:hypothetical protein